MNPANFNFPFTACLTVACLAAPVATFAQPLTLPDCIAANYDAQRHLFTIRGAAPSAANQQCLLTVVARDRSNSAASIPAGRYLIHLSDGGDGGAGGTLQSIRGGGGGGGGGAGGKEFERVVELAEGTYKLTIGAGGPGGSPCLATPAITFGGGPGWLGSPSSLTRLDTGEVLMGTAGADTYKRPSKAQNEKQAGNPDGHGGSGPGKASGGVGGHVDVTGFHAIRPEAGNSRAGNAGGDPGVAPVDRKNRMDDSGSGGGGGASTKSEGGDGGGELARHWVQPPERGALGSGGGGGEGTMFACSPGGTGGNGFMALRQAGPTSADASNQGSSSNPVRVIR